MDVKPFMVRQAQHERLKLMALTLRSWSLSVDVLRFFTAGAVKSRSHARSVGTINFGEMPTRKPGFLFASSGPPAPGDK